MGIVSAVTFATILAVVAGLTMASAGALAHDLYAQVFRRGAATEQQELRVFRVATLARHRRRCVARHRVQGHEHFLSREPRVQRWQRARIFRCCCYRCTGADSRVAARWSAARSVSISSTGMLIAGPAIWVDVLGYEQPLFGSNYPTLIAMPLALVTAWATSMLDARHRTADAQRVFDELSAKANARVGLKPDLQRSIPSRDSELGGTCKRCRYIPVDVLEPPWHSNSSPCPSRRNPSVRRCPRARSSIIMKSTTRPT